MKLRSTLTIVLLCSALAAPAGATQSNPFLDGSMAGDLQVRVLERGRQAAMSPVTASRGVPEHTLGRVISPDPPGTTPDPLLPPSCTGSCRTRAKLARVGMRLLVELARGMGR